MPRRARTNHQSIACPQAIIEVYELDVSLLLLRLLILLTLFVQDGWNRLDLGFYRSSISENWFSTSYQYRLLQNILGKLTVVPVGDTGTIPHHLCNLFPGAPGDHKPGAGDGCHMWFSTRGPGDGHVICNKMGNGICASVVQHGKCVQVIAIIAINCYNIS